MNYDFKQYILPKYSKDNYLAYWLKLLKKLDYRLGYIANDNVGYNPMRITDMADYLGISTLTCKRFIKESVELGIITKQLEKVVSQKRNVFRINPKYTLGILGWALSFNNYLKFERKTNGKKFKRINIR